MMDLQHHVSNDCDTSLSIPNPFMFSNAIIEIWFVAQIIFSYVYAIYWQGTLKLCVVIRTRIFQSKNNTVRNHIQLEVFSILCV